MTAREKFRKGQRVVATAAYRNGRHIPPYEGVVHGFPRWGGSVLILKDGRRYPAYCSVSEWEPAPEPPPEINCGAGI